jgi:hypothetical protein
MLFRYNTEDRMLQSYPIFLWQRLSSGKEFPRITYVESN